MQTITELLSTIERGHILKALEQLDAGAQTSFADSIKFDVIYKGRRYAPKEVIGLALEIAHQSAFGPRDFKGGDSSSAFRVLRRCGFTIVPKAEIGLAYSLTNVVAEILSLQTKYSSENTEAMQRRGFLVRSALKDLLYSQVERYEPIFSTGSYECSVEGSDGIGRKAKSAWTRLYDPTMSPSATQGWYIVIHFSSQGDYFYLALGCGATIFKDGSLSDVDPATLANNIVWARGCFADQPQCIERFGDTISLHGNHLSTQFERAIAFAKRYRLDGFDEELFWEDLVALSGMLVAVYEQERLGKTPLSEPPEVREYLSQLAQTTRPKNKGGQGRFLSQPEKLAVELHAMKTVRNALPEHGFTDIEDMSAKESYDFAAKRDGLDWFIEVKGTTSAHDDSFLLTANELDLHRKKKGRTVLAIVYDIELNRDGNEPTACRGQLSIDIPWDPDAWEFKPTAYSATRRQ